MTADHGFGDRFPPRTIAIVGVSRSEGSVHPGYTGLQLLRTLRDSGFQGRVYPVNPRASTLEGLQVYPRVSAIPEPPDMVIVTVPAAAVPQVLEDCVVAGTRNVQVCTSGFAETGLEEGIRLEHEVREIALRGGLRLIGPNCMGFQVPSAGMKMFGDVNLVSGPVAFVSQSGGHARIFLHHGPHLGIGFSKVISYGNAAVMDAPDFLDYLADDPETRVVCMYLEGIGDGRRLLEAVRKVSPAKPVVVWKGGLTYSGARAASSHTGSLAGDRQVWEAFFRQTGAIRVGSIEEMAEVTMALLRLKPSSGRRVAVIGAGGGDSVANGDICAEEGLEMPPVSPQTRDGLLEFIYLVNQGVMNPLDVPSVFGDVSTMRRAFDLLTADPNIDIVMVNLGAEFFLGPVGEAMGGLAGCVRDATARPGSKPIVVAVNEQSKIERAEIHLAKLREAGIAAYDSLRMACRALSRFAAYYQYVEEVRGQQGRRGMAERP
jgi:acyl-CoA synthetase (NDP forming)